MESNVNGKTLGTDNYPKRKFHRLVTIWSTNIIINSPVISSDIMCIADVFYFGRYEKFIRRASGQVPHLLFSETIPDNGIQLAYKGDYKIHSCRILVFVLPSGSVIVMVDGEFECEIRTLIEIMQCFYYKKINFYNSPLVKFLAEKLPVQIADTDNLFDEAYYQLVNISDEYADDNIDRTKVRSLIYRYYDDNISYRPEFQNNDEIYPDRLNIRVRSLCAISAYVCVIYNHQEYIESTMLLSAIQCVGAQQNLSIIRTQTFQILQDLASQEFSGLSVEQELTRLMRLSKAMELLNLRLSISAEEPMDLSLVVPSLRSEIFHQKIFNVNNIQSKINNISQMLSRIDKIISANSILISSYERESTALRRNIWTVIVSSISLIAIPVTIILTFLAAPVLEAPKNSSIFDFNTHWQLYSLVFGSVVAAFLSGAIVWAFYQMIRHRRRKKLFAQFRSMNRRLIL